MIKKSSKTEEKKTAKKLVKKPAKKIAKKTADKNYDCCPKIKVKPIGEVTHYFDHLSVAIAKFNREMKVGEFVKIKGAHTDFEQKIESMQYERQPIASAKKNQEVGIKVREKTREGDKIYLA